MLWGHESFLVIQFPCLTLVLRKMVCRRFKSRLRCRKLQSDQLSLFLMTYCCKSLSDSSKSSLKKLLQAISEIKCKLQTSLQTSQQAFASLTSFSLICFLWSWICVHFCSFSQKFFILMEDWKRTRIPCWCHLSWFRLRKRC